MSKSLAQAAPSRAGCRGPHAEGMRVTPVWKFQQLLWETHASAPSVSQYKSVSWCSERIQRFRENLLCFGLCPWPLILSLSTTEKSWTPSSLQLPFRSLQTFVRSPWSLAFTRLCSSISLSSYERCSSPFVILVALAGLCLELDPAQNWTQYSWCGLPSAEQRGRITSLKPAGNAPHNVAQDTINILCHKGVLLINVQISFNILYFFFFTLPPTTLLGFLFWSNIILFSSSDCD